MIELDISGRNLRLRDIVGFGIFSWALFPFALIIIGLRWLVDNW
jgi:hypothetical protein